MGFKNLAKGIVKNLGDAHTVEGIGGAYLRRAAAGAGIGAVAGGTVEAIQGGSFGEGAVSGAVKGGIIGAGTVAYKAAGLGSDVFEKGTHRLAKVRDKGTVFRDMWNGVDTSKEIINSAEKEVKKAYKRAPKNGKNLHSGRIDQGTFTNVEYRGTYNKHRTKKMRDEMQRIGKKPSQGNPYSGNNSIYVAKDPLRDDLYRFHSQFR